MQCDECGGPYTGNKPSFEKRLCNRCIKKLRAHRGSGLHPYRKDHGHGVLLPSKNARAMEIERAPWVRVDHLP
jgi:hypothetical protein